VIETAARRYRLGIDIGGTFTDLFMSEVETGESFGLKTPTTPDDLVQGVLNGIGLLRERGVDPGSIEYFAHGTTAGVNTVIQRVGARTALLVTEGFTDVLELGRLRLPVPWSFYSRRATPLVPRTLVVPVGERVRHTGAIERPLEEAEIARVIGDLVGLNVEGVAICLLHSYANPTHEHELRDAIGRELPDVEVSCSYDLWPQVREYERAMVTVMNAYLQPMMARYTRRLEEELEGSGVRIRPYLSRSNGGVMTVASARRQPVQTLLSGPASGVTGAAQTASRAGIDKVITLDIGGTSADVAILEDGRPGYAREARIGDFPIILPTVGIYCIGAGGGSVAWLDGGRVLRAGPKSAGAVPGPVCYGAGGTEPTLTDAFLVSGYLNPDRFAGRGSLDRDAAHGALAELGSALSLSAEQTADATIRIALATMYAELSAVLERTGIDPREFTLMAFGGAGPVLACLVAESSNIRRVLVPPAPGTLCAEGALHADCVGDFITSFHRHIGEASSGELAAELGELEEQAMSWMADEAPAHAREPESRLSADMRYVGQSYEVEVPFDRTGGEVDLEALRRGFDEVHARLYAHADPEAAVELVNIRVRVVARTELPVAPAHTPNGSAPAPVQRRVLIDGKELDATVYQRSAIAPGKTIPGPAVVEQPDSTSVVPAGWWIAADAYGNLIITREDVAA
jgi:N-methylhydantoinase A